MDHDKFDSMKFLFLKILVYGPRLKVHNEYEMTDGPNMGSEM
jgi:hypothetical protein